MSQIRGRRILRFAGTLSCVGSGAGRPSAGLRGRGTCRTAVARVAGQRHGGVQRRGAGRRGRAYSRRIGCVVLRRGLRGVMRFREVATRSRASAVVWTSQEGGRSPNRIIIGRKTRGILWKPSSRIASVGAEARRGRRVFVSEDGAKFWQPTMASHGARLLLSVPPRSWR